MLFLCLMCFAVIHAQGQERPAALTPVFLDHVYIVLDGQTYKDIVRSEFMRTRFASFSEKTTILDSQSLSAAYIGGEHTYIEIFEADRDPKFTLGMAGIGFSIEDVGGTELILRRLNAKFMGKAKTELSTVRIDNKDVPIFYATYVEYPDKKPMLATWVMERHRDYLKSRFPDIKPEDGGITRKQGMARSFKSERYFRDIHEVTIALDDGQASRLINELEAFGYAIRESGKKKICRGPGVTFIVTPLTAPLGGITKLKISLMRKKQGQKAYKFGARSVLTFKGETASWVF